MSRIIPTIYPVTLIKVEPSTGEPIRDEKGLCIRCEPGKIFIKVKALVSVEEGLQTLNTTILKKKILCFI